MTVLASAVGRKTSGTAAQSLPDDQAKVIDLLNRISPIDGGQRGIWTLPSPGAAYHPPAELVRAIKVFQQRWVATGEVKKVDGVVDPNGATIGQLDAKAGAAPPTPIGPGGTDPSDFDGITITRISQATTPYIQTPSVLGPILNGVPIQTMSILGGCFLFIFKVEKDGHRYWVGAAVPPLTVDYTKIQVFLHATPQQAGVKASDYHSFKGDWETRMTGYLTRGGTQLSAARNMPLLVPFMVDAAMSADSPANVFATRPIATLNALMTATRREMATRVPIVPFDGAVKVAKLGVTSFSSGIHFLRAFITQFGGSGVIAETIDLDSRWIVAERTKPWVRASNAKASWYAQWSPAGAPAGMHYPPAPPGFFYAPGDKLMKTGLERTAHAVLGFDGYYQAMLKSSLI